MKSIPNRRSMNRHTVRGVGQELEKPMEERLNSGGEVCHLLFRHAVKIRAVNLRDDPGFEGVARSEWRKD